MGPLSSARYISYPTYKIKDLSTYGLLIQNQQSEIYLESLDILNVIFRP